MLTQYQYVKYCFSKRETRVKSVTVSQIIVLDVLVGHDYCQFL